MFGEGISPFTHIPAVLRVGGPPRSSHVELHATVTSTLDLLTGFAECGRAGF